MADKKSKDNSNSETDRCEEHLVRMDRKAGGGKNTMSRFEIEEDGQTAYLEFELDGAGWMTLWHTEVPEALRGRGLANELVKSAFDYAKANELRVDVICPIALHYLEQHPEVKEQGIGSRE